MKKVILFIFIFIWLAIALIAPNYLGMRVEADFRAYLTSQDVRTLRQQGVELSLLDYHRGYFRSQAHVAFSIHHPSQATPWLNTELEHDITHAPLSFSGFNLVRIQTHNTPNLSGQIGKNLPEDIEDIIEADIGISLIGTIHEKIQLKPFHIDNLPTAFKALQFNGATIQWHSHLKHFPQQGHGSLQTNAIELYNQYSQPIHIHELTAKLTIDKYNHSILNIPALTFNVPTATNQQLTITATDIEQSQFSTLLDKTYPIAYALNMKELDIALDDQPQIQAKNLATYFGLKKVDTHYQLSFDWVADISVDPAIKQTNFAWLYHLPPQQQLSLTLAPITEQQIFAWSPVIDSLLLPNLPLQQKFAWLGQLIRQQIVKQRNQITLTVACKDSDKPIVSADVFIDENIDDPQKINALVNHGINPHWFFNSHARFYLNRQFIEPFKISRLLMIILGKNVAIDNDGNWHIDTQIIDHKLIVNEQTY